MGQYLYRLTPTRPDMTRVGATPEESAIVGEHFSYFEGLMEEGVLILAGRTQIPDSFGIMIFNADSDEAAQVIMDNDPAVKKNVMRAELFPYRIALIREANVKE